MHRILNVARNENNNLDFIEQPTADYVYITSVKSDINILSELVENEADFMKNKIRALELCLINNPSQIDYYISKTLIKTKIVILRIFGDRGTWNYGLEQIRIWNENNKKSQLIVLSGTEEQDISLNELSSINLEKSIKLSKLLRTGGKENFLKFLNCLKYISSNCENIPDEFLRIKSYSDPYAYDWKEEKGIKVGIISYRSLYLANEVELTDKLNFYLRKFGISPRTFFVSTLKKIEIQQELLRVYKNENIKLLITTTSFDSTIKNNEGISNFNLFEELGIPVIQILTSTKSRAEWKESNIGMCPIDLLMQIIIPEFDGRITTIPCSFKELSSINNNLCTEVTKYQYDNDGLIWVIKLAVNYIKLNNLKNFHKNVCLIVSNYPVKNGRLANGVGLNTPESIINILHWLKEEGYDTGNLDLPKSSKELMSMLIKARTNDQISFKNKPLDYITLAEYKIFWDKLPFKSKEKIIKRWDYPEKSSDLEKKGFSINGIIFGKICILIQPHRGYEINNLNDIHSPDLPPPHRYLAQYFWIENIFNSNVICHIGKHGTVEWLPGKSVGLSEECFPRIICPPIPLIYPFIVNDPGEGSQAKRRTHATIIDHLTPPLDRSELYGYLTTLEKLVDEYYESRLLDSKRIEIISDSIINIAKNEFKDIFDYQKPNLIEKIDTYLCELKEAQIRVGLHTFGVRPKNMDQINLILCIARVPTNNRDGIIQFISKILRLDFESWTNNYGQELSENDLKILQEISDGRVLNFRIAIEFLEEQAKYLIYYYFFKNKIYIQELEKLKSTKFFNKYANRNEVSNYLNLIQKEIIQPLNASSYNEKKAFISSLSGNYVKSGPSGAPTRGKIEVLPTGKNFYSVDTRGLPTESAWVMGDESARQILDLYLQDKGENLKNLAISLWATSTMRNGGEDICQIFSLMGVKPIWDGPTRRVIGIEVIPLNVLLRPRVDVTLRISGMFRDSFPNLIKLISEAIYLVANLNEDKVNNPLSYEYKKLRSIDRIFGSAPGSYGAGLQELISNSSWNEHKELSEAYLNWSQWIYDENSKAKFGRKSFEKVLKNVQVVIHNQDNREHDILDSDDYYQFHGGLAISIKEISGKYPEIYFGDLSKFGKSKITTLKSEIDKVMRTRVLNPKWINGMMKNGYKGGFEFSATLDYLYAYDATTNCVSNWSYESIYKSWICNEEIKKYLSENNPWALKDIAERLLELINRGMWENKSNIVIEDLKSIINETEYQIERNF